jgi:flagellar hook-associated protein 1 FlgK
MGGLSTSLQIGMQALNATQDALTATANNIANANTPGYTEEVAQFSENAATYVGTGTIDGGVSLSGLHSLRDELLNVQIQQQTSQQNSATAQSSSLQGVQTYFTSNGEDIASALTSLSTSLAALSASPSSSAAQQGVLSAGQNLASAFNTTANGLTSAQTSAGQQVTDTVDQINTLTNQLAQLNGQLEQLPSGQDGGTIEDKRDELVQQLSGLTGVSITQSSSGEDITTGNGTALVLGDQSVNLQTATGSNGFQDVLDSNGNDITSSIQGGTLGGAIQIRDQTIPGFLTQLNTLATQFGTAFNTAQAQGYDSNGNAGQNFFTIPTSTASAAAGISVAITSPSQIAVSSGTGGGNGNVANLSATLTSALPSGQTAASSYASLVFNVGTAASNASTQSTAIGQNLLQLTNQQSATSGVNIDDETANLIRYQTAYEAAARIVSTIESLDSTTISMASS